MADCQTKKIKSHGNVKNWRNFQKFKVPFVVFFSWNIFSGRFNELTFFNILHMPSQFPHYISSVIILGIIMSQNVTSLLVMWYLFADANIFSKASFFCFRFCFFFVEKLSISNKNLVVLCKKCCHNGSNNVTYNRTLYLFLNLINCIYFNFWVIKQLNFKTHQQLT